MNCMNEQLFEELKKGDNKSSNQLRLNYNYSQKNTI